MAEIGDEDIMGFENKRKCQKNSSSILSDPIEQMYKKGYCLVGKVMVTRTDGIFENPHETGKFVEGKRWSC